EPVTVPKGSTRADVARALKDAGVLSSRQKMFGLSEKAQEVMFSRSAMKSTEANIARGRESLAKALNEKTTVHRAMFRNGLGWVDFVWGSEGRVKPSGKTQGAMGIAHILEARQRKDGLSEKEAIQSLSKVVESIALGQEVARLSYDNSVAVRVENAGYRVSLTQNPGSNAWVVTAFEVSQAHGRSGFDTRPSTQPISTLSREGLGADSMATGDTSSSLKGATHRDSTKRGSPTGADSTNSVAPIYAGSNADDKGKWSGDGTTLNTASADANPDILYSKSAKPVTNPTAVKMRRDMVQRTVDALAKGWAKAPNVTVVDSMQDERVPEAVRKADEAQRSQGAMGEPEGFWYRGQVYLVASALPTSADAARVLYHEVLGHHGLRGHFGKDLDRVLDQVIKLRRKDVQAKAQEYGLDMGNPEHAGYAAEEVLAELAQSRPDLGFVQRAIAAIRNFLRTHVPGFKVLELTDADIVQGYLLPARGWVERGADAGSTVDDPMLSRSGGTDSEAQRQFKETERAYGGKAAYERAKAAGKTKLTYGQWVQVRTPNFKAWFGDWEVQSSNSVVNQQIEQWASGELPANVILNIGHPSSVLTQHGVPNMPITLRQAILRKAVKDKHGVAAAQLKDIAQAVQAPTAIFDDPDNPGTRIAVTEIGIPMATSLLRYGSTQNVMGWRSMTSVASTLSATAVFCAGWKMACCWGWTKKRAATGLRT
ncbi:MAG: hypothetical protein PHE74_09110, partial [Comamonas sp.]|nr:hypothetical protein [Comamonas sp.]